MSLGRITPSRVLLHGKDACVFWAAIAIMCVNAGCATAPRMSYVAPEGTSVEVEGVPGSAYLYPNKSAKNAVEVNNWGFPGTSTKFVVTCKDGNSERRELENEYIPLDRLADGILYSEFGILLSVVGVYFWGVNGSFTDSDFAGLLGNGLCLLGGMSCAVSASHLLFHWRPADALTVDTSADVCRPKSRAIEAVGTVDSDGDGFVNRLDRCPSEPETVNNVNDDDGCPDEGVSYVALKDGKIELSQKIFFESDKAVIAVQSHPLLNQVATVFKNHPEIDTVRVEGHTDAFGDPAANLALSQARADAVKAYLVSRGITAGRLEAKGFGLTRPIADNSTPEGREKNRRVEFVIAP
jgi:outer membrane protein OmpA-like peptidoglycan-associated protein